MILAICFLTFLGKVNFCNSRSYCKNKRKLVDRTVCVCNFLNLLFICTVFVFYWLLMFIKHFLLSLNLFLVYLTRIITRMINWTWQPAHVWCDDHYLGDWLLLYGFVPRHSLGSRYKYHHLVNSNVNSKMEVRERMMSF